MSISIKIMVEIYKNFMELLDGILFNNNIENKLVTYNWLFIKNILDTVIDYNIFAVIKILMGVKKLWLWFLVSLIL